MSVVNVPLGSPYQWQDPVPTILDLPFLLNNKGDLRSTIDNGIVYVWTGAAWVVAIGGGGGGGGAVNSVGVTAPLYETGTATDPIINIYQAGASSSGYLSSTDWNTFNSMQPTSQKNQPNGYAGIDSQGFTYGTFQAQVINQQVNIPANTNWIRGKTILGPNANIIVGDGAYLIFV